jgi:hypothetical protein
MPRRPDDEGPEPEGGGAAERLRQHLDSRYPAGEWPPAPIEDIRDAGDEPLLEGPPAEDEERPDASEPAPEPSEAIPDESEDSSEQREEADRQPDDPEDSEDLH